MPQRLYMDNAATSFPKPRAVLDAMTHYAAALGASAGRGAYAEAREVGRLIYECRERLCRLLGGEDPDHVVFTHNTTDALNLAIKGVVGAHPADRPHVITTAFDHNSVLRPLNHLADVRAIDQTRVPCDPGTGLVDPADIRAAIRPDTALIAVVHGSNVTGTLQPVADIGRIARDHDIPLLVDAAQTLGHVPLDVARDCIDLLAFPGHKGLLGPLGTGGLYIRPGLDQRMTTLREGGTGSVSEHDRQPELMPDRFEPGSHNAIGILGLSAAVAWILDQGIDNLWQHHRTLIAAMLQGLEGDIPGLTLYGPPGVRDRAAVFSLRLAGFDPPQALSDLLESDYGILTRSGIHCAPLAHQTLGTAALAGTTRFSLGPFNTTQDVTYACDALAQIAQARAVPATAPH
ncbi:MAG: aminotransferase class V-fold PLP-dependent enzyme [Phycisphaeraceae bacterium]